MGKQQPTPSSDGASNRAPPQRVSGVLRLAVGLLLTPCAVVLAEWTLPALQVRSSSASVIAFAGAAGVSIVGLAIAASAEVALGLALGVAGLAFLALLLLAVAEPAPGVALPLVDAALVCLAWALGTSLGRRVQHVAHLFPACVVAASADLVSLVSPEGPSHAIAESERALSVLAVWFPVPASNAVAPALGVGDLLFMALVFGVARAHALPYARVVACCALGVALAGVAAAWLGVAVPALVPIAVVVIGGLPAVRRLRPADRKAAHWSMLIAGTIAVATIARGFLASH